VVAQVEIVLDLTGDQPGAKWVISCERNEGSASAEIRSTIHLVFVMDNLNIHCEKSFTVYFGRRRGRSLWRRVRVHFTPKYGSWLNQVEIELSLVSRGCLGHRRIATLPELC
jgi:hypothetical protein